MDAKNAPQGVTIRREFTLSPARLQQLLTALLETELEVGLTFEQQVKMGPGIPDALIKQESLRLFFETKRGSYLDADQIERHCKGIAAKGKRPGDVLVGLTKEPILESERNKLVAMAAEHGVAFVSATFSGIVEALKLQTADYERDFLALIDDYEAYLTEERLLDESGRKSSLIRAEPPLPKM